MPAGSMIGRSLIDDATDPRVRESHHALFRAASQIATPLITAYGWRLAMVIVSLLVWMLLVPAVVMNHVVNWMTLDTGPYASLWFLTVVFVPFDRNGRPSGEWETFADGFAGSSGPLLRVSRRSACAAQRRHGPGP